MARYEAVDFGGRIVLVGYGAIGQCLVPTLERHFRVASGSITILDRLAPPPSLTPWLDRGYKYVQAEITRDNFTSILSPLLGAGDLCINVCPGINQYEVMKTVNQLGAICIDTAPEPWQDNFTAVPLWMRSCYDMLFALRENAKSLPADGPTAVVYHGANPGIVSHFVKAALIDVAKAMRLEFDIPATKNGWARLSQRTGTKVIHVSERDSQVSNIPRKLGEFPCTWCPDDMIAESLYLPSEIGWGTHEKHTPAASTLANYGSGNALRIEKAGGLTLVRSWVPSGPIWGNLTSHTESMTIADMLSIYDTETSIPGDAAGRHRSGRAFYRPTCHYAYLPPTESVAGLRDIMASNLEWPKVRLMREDIIGGMDELGVLLMGHGANAWWFGSRMNIHQARNEVAGHGPTAMQVVGGVLGAAVWAIKNPNRGVCEPEDLPYDEILKTAMPYLEPIVSVQTDWNPLAGRPGLGFQSPAVDNADVWQFCNFLVG